MKRPSFANELEEEEESQVEDTVAPAPEGRSASEGVSCNGRLVADAAEVLGVSCKVLLATPPQRSVSVMIKYMEKNIKKLT